MKNLRDYSGQFIPELKASDFSHDTLAGLLSLYGKLYLAVDGFWYLTVKERINNQEAIACDIGAWEKLYRYEMSRIRELLNIQGNDVAALMKSIQVTPWFWHTEHKIELENRNTALLTITRCITLDALEKEGEGRENEICKIFCPLMFKRYASFFNSDIEVKPLKSPPRKSKDEVCCQWEFTGDK